MVFSSKNSNGHALFYNLVFDRETKFPKILESIKHPEEAVVLGCSVKKVFLEISQNSH